MRELESMQAQGIFDEIPKKEALTLRKELEKLQKNLDGIRDLNRRPDAVFVVDTKKEDICVREARKLGLPIIAIVDTNCDPDDVDYVIPGNDDAIRSAALMSRVVADAVDEGRVLAQKKGGKAAAKAEAQAPPPDPEAERRKADDQRRARGEAAKAQEQREARLRDAKRKPPPPPPDTGGDGASEAAPPAEAEAAPSAETPAEAPVEATTESGGGSNG
jgi:small subunit ribosomal protein S2